MKIGFFSLSRPQSKKNDALISFITNDLGSAYTLPTPQNRLCTRSVDWAAERRSKRHDA